MKRIALLSAAFAVVLFAPVSTSVVSAGCVDISASVNPASVCAGTTASVTTSVTNCGELSERVELQGGLNGIPLPAKASIRVPGGKTRSATAQVRIPAGTAPGAYTLTVTATTATGGQDTETVSVTVSECL